MNNTLKSVGNIGAELAAAKAQFQLEMERHRKTWRQLEQVRGLLREIRGHFGDGGIGSRIDTALSQQAETSCSACNDSGWERRLGRDNDEIVESCSMCTEPAPAQTEQQPVAWRRMEADDNESASWSYYSGPVEGGVPVYATPIVQTAPQPEEVKAAIRNLRCIGKTVLSSEARASMRADLESAAQLLIKLSTPQPEQSGLAGKCWVEVIGGREGPSLYIGDGEIAHRLAGNKPWGGGATLHRFAVDIPELVREATALSAQV